MNSDKPLHILILPSEEYTPERAPLSGIFQKDQALMLHRNGCRVGVLSVNDPIAFLSILKTLFRKILRSRTYYNPLNGESLVGIIKILYKQLFDSKTVFSNTSDGISVVKCGTRCWNDEGDRRLLKYFVKSARVGFEYYCQHFSCPDLIHAHNAWFAGIAAGKLASSANIKYGITEHSTYYSRGLIQKHYYPDIRNIYKDASFNVVVSLELGNLLEKNGLINRNEYKYIPNVLDPIFERLHISKNSNLNRPFVFLNVAALTKKKGHSLLLHAIKCLDQDLENVIFKIVGDGEEETSLKELTIELGISHRVIFQKSLTRIELAREMVNCDVFILPSIHETFGVVLIEAMACGKPVLATKCGGPETFVNNEVGILVEPGDVNELIHGIKYILLNVEKFDSDYIRQSTIQRFGVDNISDQLITLYNNCLGK